MTKFNKKQLIEIKDYLIKQARERKINYLNKLIKRGDRIFNTEMALILIVLIGFALWKPSFVMGLSIGFNIGLWIVTTIYKRVYK